MCGNHRPQGEERNLCFPSDPAVQFVPMIRDGERITEDTETQQGITIPWEFRVMKNFNSNVSPRETQSLT